VSRIGSDAASWSSASAEVFRVTIVHFVIFTVFAFPVQAATQAGEEEGSFLKP